MCVYASILAFSPEEKIIANNYKYIVLGEQ